MKQCIVTEEIYRRSYLSGWYLSIKLCISPHFPSISLINEVGISSLPSSSSEECSSAAIFCLLPLKVLGVPAWSAQCCGPLPTPPHHHIHFQARGLVQTHNILQNKHRLILKLSSLFQQQSRTTISSMLIAWFWNTLAPILCLWALNKWGY